MFLVALFLAKNNLLFKNGVLGINQTPNSQGLTYKTQTLAELVNQDTDGDGIPDWEEKLYGTDPTKAETVAGVPDSVTIEKLKAPQATAGNTQINAGDAGAQNTTSNKTDEFSKDLLASAAALSNNGNGTIDQNAIDQLGSSFADKLQNSPQRIVYALSDISVGKTDNIQTIQKYLSVLNALYPKKAVSPTVMDVLQKFEGDGTNVNADALSQLDPFIKQTKVIIVGMLKMNVPPSLASYHLNLINSLEYIYENLNDIQLYNTDPLASLSAVNQYVQNLTNLNSSAQTLAGIINTRLNG